jgi:predicted DNA-binding transcriptional regulator YafY
VVLRLTPEASSTIDLAAWPRSARLRQLDHGAANLEFEFDSPQELLSRLLSFGDDAEVVEPDDLRSAMSDLALRIAHRHGRKENAGSSPAAAIADDPLALPSVVTG